MSDVFTETMKRTALMEGKYSNDPNDRGGETNFGITVAVARAFGYRGEMRLLTYETALHIYRQRYWEQPYFDKIEPIHPDIAAWLLDFGINAGQVTAGKCLQHALNVLNDRGALYPDLIPDGVCGAMTRAALQALLSKRGSEGRVLFPRFLIAFQALHYVDIMEKDPTQEKFGWGWVRRAFV